MTHKGHSTGYNKDNNNNNNNLSSSNSNIVVALAISKIIYSSVVIQ